MYIHVTDLLYTLSCSEWFVSCLVSRVTLICCILVCHMQNPLTELLLFGHLQLCLATRNSEIAGAHGIRISCSRDIEKNDSFEL